MQIEENKNKDYCEIGLKQKYYENIKKNIEIYNPNVNRQENLNKNIELP